MTSSRWRRRSSLCYGRWRVDHVLKGTSFANERPAALPPDFYEDTVRAQHRQELHRQIATNIDSPAQLADSGEELRDFQGPICNSLIEESPFTQVLSAGGPWRPGTQP